VREQEFQKRVKGLGLTRTEMAERYRKLKADIAQMTVKQAAGGVREGGRQGSG
jgi:hypothetical protein